MSEKNEKTASEQAREARKLEQIRQRTAVVSGLSAKQRLFVIRYLLHGNRTRAYLEAGYNTKYPDRAASRLAKNPKVVEAIEEYFHADEMSAREAVAILSRQARGSMADFIHLPRNKDGEPIYGLPPSVDLWKAEEAEQLALIKKIKITERTSTTNNGDVIESKTVDFELYDAQSAAEKVGRYHGIFKDRTDITSGGEPIEAINIYIPDNGRNREGGDDGEGETGED